MTIAVGMGRKATKQTSKTLTNNAAYAAFHKGLHRLLRLKQTPGTEINHDFYL